VSICPVCNGSGLIRKRLRIVSSFPVKYGPNHAVAYPHRNHETEGDVTCAACYGSGTDSPDFMESIEVEITVEPKLGEFGHGFTVDKTITSFSDKVYQYSPPPSFRIGR